MLDTKKPANTESISWFPLSIKNLIQTLLESKSNL